MAQGKFAGFFKSLLNMGEERKNNQADQQNNPN